MPQYFGELERIEFGHEDDERVILVGRGIPFRYGKAAIIYTQGEGALSIRIKPDPLTEKSMNAERLMRRSWLERLFDFVRGHNG